MVNTPSMATVLHWSIPSVSVKAANKFAKTLPYKNQADKDLVIGALRKRG